MWRQLTEKAWRPRRDLNPCYRRESSRSRKQTRGTDGTANAVKHSRERLLNLN